MSNALDYLSYYHGMELDPNAEPNKRHCENGILFLVEYVLLLKVFGKEDEYNTFSEATSTIINNIRSKDAGGKIIPGLFDRGSNESVTVPYQERRTISHDNISAIASFSYMNKKHHAQDIADYGLNHFFVYNNCKPKFRTPMNPGNYSHWLFCGGYERLYLLFIPFYLINMFLDFFEDDQSTTGRWLLFTELYPLKDKNKVWGWIWKQYTDEMVKIYGPNFLKRLAEIYFHNPDHPIRVLLREDVPQL